jgi:hypothetical protein
VKMLQGQCFKALALPLLIGTSTAGEPQCASSHARRYSLQGVTPQPGWHCFRHLSPLFARVEVFFDNPALLSYGLN